MQLKGRHARIYEAIEQLLSNEFVLRTCMRIKLNIQVRLVETSNAKLFILCMFLSGPLFVRRVDGLARF